MRVRVWDPDTLRGRMFVQFVALCYYEYLSEQVRQMRATLGVPNGDPVHDLKKNLDLESKLKTWLNNTPLYLQLQWFDVVETVEISSALRMRRFSTEVTLRDQLYLERLGGEAAPQPECCSVCAQKAPARPGLPWSCPPA